MLTTSASNMPTMHFIYHIDNFHYIDDGKDQNSNNFLFSIFENQLRHSKKVHLCLAILVFHLFWLSKYLSSQDSQQWNCQHLRLLNPNRLILLSVFHLQTLSKSTVLATPPSCWQLLDCIYCLVIKQNMKFCLLPF